MHLENTALVLEGGGMRGMFSAGVFEAFLQHELTFPYITAVSAGACNILSYMAHQPMRTRKIIEKYVGTKPYFSISNYLRTGSLFGWDFIFDKLPKELLPFDYETYAQYPGELHVGTTDVSTGEAVWHYNKRAEIAFKSVIASASLPFLAPIVNIDNRPLLDGAIVSPIPIDKAKEAEQMVKVVMSTPEAELDASLAPKPGTEEINQSSQTNNFMPMPNIYNQMGSYDVSDKDNSIEPSIIPYLVA